MSDSEIRELMGLMVSHLTTLTQEVLSLRGQREVDRQFREADQKEAQKMAADMKSIRACADKVLCKTDQKTL